jgi:hypothetical protein
LAKNLPVLVIKVHILSCVQENVGENWSFNAEVIMGQYSNEVNVNLVTELKIMSSPLPLLRHFHFPT